MYDELIGRLREPCQYENCILCQQAADAIEELNKKIQALRMDNWDVTCDPEYRESHFEKTEWGD